MSQKKTAPPEKPLRKAQQWRKRNLWYAGIGVLIGGSVAALGIASLFRPASSEHRPVRIVIPTGAGMGRIGEVLQAKGVIRSALAFNWYARWKGEGSKFKAGRYRLSGDMSLAQIMQELDTGPNPQTDESERVTVPEGFTLKQVADLLEDKGVADARAFRAAAAAPDAIARLHADFPLPEKTLEGYLFPNTYYYAERTPPTRIAQEMLMNFYTRFYRPYQQEIERRGIGLHALVTEASLIEREAKVPQDRARIAGVLENRLKQGMRLEIDATVLYALGHHKDQVLLKDLKVNSPYNTYRHKGLPPGPIANPGLDSLLAALRPENHDFLYYVARPDGSHLFSRTRAEHEAAIKQTQVERRQEDRTEAQPGG